MSLHPCTPSTLIGSTFISPQPWKSIRCQFHAIELTPASSKSKSKSRKKSKTKTGTKGASSKDGEAGKAGAAKK